MHWKKPVFLSFLVKPVLTSDWKRGCDHEVDKMADAECGSLPIALVVKLQKR